MGIRSIAEIEKAVVSGAELLRDGGCESADLPNGLQTWLAEDDQHGTVLDRGGPLLTA
jgi:hypothetical protein